MPLLQIGDSTSAFTLPNHQSIRTSLDKFRSPRVLLWWDPKADTPG